MLSQALCILLLAATAMAQKSTEDRKKAVAGSTETLTDMYVTLMNIVFPKAAATANDPVFNRFVLMMPGKVLNYWDYYPGKDYEESLLRINESAPEASVPPSVMEKWFDISDVTVGPDIFAGGVTAKSFGTTYSTILKNTKVLGLDAKHAEEQKKYAKALDYLAGELMDPEDITSTVTRLALYDRYQKQYADAKLDMENRINDARSSRGSVEYELWFQRNYPSMNMEVEGIYTKWLAFGQKDLVELYKAYLDSGSSGAEVEDARMALRGSGVVSLDRTRTIYPVSFEPGNWYKYLLPSSKPPSRDMLTSKISMYQSELDALTTMTTLNENANANATEAISALNASYANASSIAESKAQEALDARYACLNTMSKNHVVKEEFEKTDPKKDDKDESSESSKDSGDSEDDDSGGGKASAVEDLAQPGSSEECSQMRKSNEEAVGAAFQQAQLHSQLQSAQFYTNARGEYNTFLSTRADRLKAEISVLEQQLKELNDTYLGGVADSAEFTDLNKLFEETQQNLDDAWTVFSYDSDSTHIATSQDTTSVNANVNVNAAKAPNKAMNLDVGVSYGAQELKQAMNSASLKVSGKVLRVTIKRPWFKPSVFEDPSLYFSFHDDSAKKTTFVSPGPVTSNELKNSIGGLANNLYIMPEYVSSFLIAKDLKLEFSGMDSASVSRGMQFAATAKFSGTYNMVNLNAAVGVNKNTQSLTADRTSTGMIITVPGAQIIGYYTNVLPKFPQDQ